MKKDYDLERFVNAQETVYDNVCAELKRGRKHGHWMWFVFPQIKGLGRSPSAHVYAIRSIDEAEAYLRHPVLGGRLIECTRLVMMAEGKSIEQIFGKLDAMKFKSSMTLFSQASPYDPLFENALEKFFGGEFDDKTLKRLHKKSGMARLSTIYQAFKRLFRS